MELCQTGRELPSAARPRSPLLCLAPRGLPTVWRRQVEVFEAPFTSYRLAAALGQKSILRFSLLFDIVKLLHPLRALSRCFFFFFLFFLIWGLWSTEEEKNDSAPKSAALESEHFRIVRPKLLNVLLAGRCSSKKGLKEKPLDLPSRRA